MNTSHPTPPLIAFLLGKPVRDDTVFPEVFDRLRAIPTSVRVHVPTGDEPLPAWVFNSRLVAQRGLAPRALSAALALEEAGVRSCNSVSATIATGNRVELSRKLAAAGLPVPAMELARAWPEAVELAAGRSVVLKAVDGNAGRGLGVHIAASGELPDTAPFDGPYLVQDRVQGDGQDHKLYVAGNSVRGLLKRWPPQREEYRRGVPFAVSAELEGIAQKVGQALGLELYGVDILYGKSGPVIVDVNPFPGFRGIAGAAELIALHLAEIATGRRA